MKQPEKAGLLITAIPLPNRELEATVARFAPQIISPQYVYLLSHRSTWRCMVWYFCYMLYKTDTTI